ncbi:MAG TPA: twin-arginine translocase subunit TatC [Candidatus Hydrogenedentes bacterium]|jgi:sec-independent protein translocase protein TatC|nr:twin-arginine translocase subunit TatC [Candidatus Hydrogenedentota bacterium]HPJ98681.1 twin-arginine translocase subunit TatC [Candidatus Hydrogenedentota bacterium]
MSEQTNNSDYEARMTFTEHLAELRIRIIRAGIAAILGMFVAYAVGAYLEDALMWPIIGFMAEKEHPAGQGEALAPSTPADGESATPPADGAATRGSQPATPRVRQQWTNFLAPVLLRLKIAAYAGVLLVSPYIIYQICAFIFPGLKPNEKKAVRILLTGSGVLAIVGVCVAYFGILPVVIPYLLNTFISPEIELNLRRDETIPIIVKLLTGFAIAFQFPMVVLVLVYLDLLSPQALKKYRKIAVVILAVASAVLTPPDVFSMIVMLLPLLILYETSIVLSYLVVRSKKKKKAARASA